MEARAPEEIAAARGLFREYADSLGFELSFQDFERELADPAAVYALILLAPGCGCVALRDLGDGVCELKRLYVLPAARGTGLGRVLSEAAIAHARARGYARLRLDNASVDGRSAKALRIARLPRDRAVPLQSCPRHAVLGARPVETGGAHAP